MTDSEMRAVLSSKVAELSIEATQKQHELAQQWVQLLHKWNQQYNLSAHHSYEDILNDLLIDSLAALPYLRGQRIVDVGSGAGVPGIPLAIYCPDQHFTLIDSTNKKARFTEHCRIFLGIDNIQVECCRIEDYTASDPFSTIISRAFGKLTDFIQASYHAGDKNSLWLTFKSMDTAQEIKEMQQQDEHSWDIQSHPYTIDAKTRQLLSASLRS